MDQRGGDRCQFMAVPPQYDEAAAAATAELMHQLMAVAAAAGDGDQQQQQEHEHPAGAGRGGERKRRFTEEQVRSLETTFHARRANKLEPREKAALARELGLQPRQVAIWFQNKRARWRSKQLEHDYAALRARCDDLHARVESLRHHNAALAKQVDELRGRLNERQDQSGSSCEANDAADDKGNNSTSSLVQDDGGATANATATATPPAVVDAGSEDSAAAATGQYYDDDYDHIGMLHDPDPFCAAPDLWDTWPLLEWNAVA